VIRVVCFVLITIVVIYLIPFLVMVCFKLGAYGFFTGKLMAINDFSRKKERKEHGDSDKRET
jgi:hypothetical protein